MNGKRAFYRSQLNLLKPFVDKCSLNLVRRTQDKIGRLMANSYKDAVDAEVITVEGVRCAMLTPKEELSAGVILYLHGGGYVAGNLDYAKGFGTVLAYVCLQLSTDLLLSTPILQRLTTLWRRTVIFFPRDTSRAELCSAVTAQAAVFATLFAKSCVTRAELCLQVLLPYPLGPTLHPRANPIR